MASSAIIGTKVGPYSQGSGLVLLYHLLGEHDGEFGAWAFHKQGNGGFTKVLARAAESFGVEIKLESPVDHVITDERPGDRRRARGRRRVPRADRRLGARPAPDVPRARRSARAADRPRRRRSSGSASRARRPRSTSRSTASRATRPSATGPTSTAASRTSGRRWSTSSGPSTTPSTAGTRSGRTSTARSSPTVDPDMAPARQGGLELVRPVRAVPPARERLGHRAGAPRRHRPGDARVVLPGLRQARAPARGSHAARHRADGRPVARATSSPASSSRRRCSSSGPRPAGRSTGRRSTATTSAAPARIRAAASWARRASWRPGDPQGPRPPPELRSPVLAAA